MLASMRHRLPSILRISTLAAAILAALFWAASYLVFPLAEREAYSGIGTELIAMRGSLIFYRYNSYAINPPEQEFGFNFIPESSGAGQRLKAEFGTETSPNWLVRRGFIARSGPFYGPQSSVIILMVPLWLLLAFFACPSAMHYVRRRLRKQPDGAKPCEQCGYDLRASQERCPECGFIPAQQAAD